jgi:hypothetical protein
MQQATTVTQGTSVSAEGMVTPANRPNRLVTKCFDEFK